VSQADHHIGNLYPGVVDVVLYVHMLSGGTQQANKRVAQDALRR